MSISRLLEHAFSLNYAWDTLINLHSCTRMLVSSSLQAGMLISMCGAFPTHVRPVLGMKYWTLPKRVSCGILNKDWG